MTLIKGLIQIIKEKRTLYFYQKKSGSTVTLPEISLDNLYNNNLTPIMKDNLIASLTKKIKNNFFLKANNLHLGPIL